MRLRSWILPALLATPLLVPFDQAAACLRFKKPAGSIAPGAREPSDPPPAPEPTPAPTPTDPSPTAPTGGATTPTPTAPVTPNVPAPVTPGGDNGGGRKKQGDDSSTWETWWALNRIEFFPHRYVQAVVTSEGPMQKGAKPLAPAVVREKLWTPLMRLKDDKQVFVREAALITIGRIASDDSLRAEAREILLKAINDKNHLVARSAALGLFYVADESCVLPMVQLAKNTKTPTDVRAFLALTLTALKSDMAGAFLIGLISADKDADFELVASSIMALGFIPGPESARFLKETYENKKFRAELRAVAVESFGRRGSFEDGEAILRDAIDDREIHIRRSAAMALGLLDYRTPSERAIAELSAPYKDEAVGFALPADVAAKVTELTKAVPAEREKMQKPVRDIVKKLVHSLENDNDSFTSSMCAISLGRIAAQVDESFAIRRLEADLKKERNNVREFEILALAIAKAPSAYEIALEAINGRNRQATTQGAGIVALGILGDARGNQVLRTFLEENPHPVLRGLAAMSAGMLGESKSFAPIMTLLKSTKSPDAMSTGALGLAFLGKKEGSDLLVKRLTETSNGDVAAFNVYALGLMKDRTKLDALVDISQNHGNFFVQSAAVAALGYVSSAEEYPRRHLMARGFNYMLNLQLLENYFYKL